MLQNQFSNFSGIPDFYSNEMTNMHYSGYGYFGMSGSITYLGWRAFETGEGWTFELKESINYNLIFQC